MSDRILKILLSALGVLVVGWAIATFATRRGDAPESAPFDLASAAEAQLDSVVVIGATDTIRLHGGAAWTVNGKEAIPEAGRSLSHALEAARIGQLASRSPANHERLGVGERSGRRVTFYAEDSVELDLIIGGKQTFDQSYVRRAGDDEVYVLRGSLVNLANRGVNEWRNKQILTALRGDIYGIEIDRPEELYSLRRDTTGWHLEPAGVEVDDLAVSSMLNQLSGLTALGFVPDTVADTLTWEPLAGRVRLAGPGGAPLGDLQLYEREDNTGYYVRRSDSPVVFTLSNLSGDQILTPLEELTEASGE